MDVPQPMSDAEIDAANDSVQDLWIHFRCRLYGEIEGCFNRTRASMDRVCFPCSLRQRNLEAS